MSITDELRELAKTLTHWWYDPVKDEYTYTTSTMLPLIDAIRLDSNIIAIADRIDVEHEKALDERDSERFNALMDAREKGVSAVLKEPGGFGLVELPKDADGEHIHVGDVMEHNGVRANVLGITFHGTTPPTVCIVRGDCWVEADELHHVKQPTVEDVLTEFGIDWEYESDCEDRAALLKEYATKLQLKEDE